MIGKIDKRLRHILDKPRFLWYFLNYLLAISVCRLFCGQERYKDLWLIAERGIDAQDNGYYFYRYLRKYHPELNVRYVLSKNSPDRKRFLEKDRLICYRSFEHYLALVLAEYKISTHIMGFAPDMWFFSEIDRIYPQRGKIIFLQHGIIKDDIRWLHSGSCRMDLFVCGAKREAEAVQEGYRHPPEVVKYLGLCRYDGLRVEKDRKQNGIILFMPTWRQYLKDTSLCTFKKSEYFIGIQMVLNSRKISDLLYKWGYELLFYPHYEVQKYLPCFHSDFPNIKIAKPDYKNVQTLLKEADCLITDYSSVFFDFAYMRKPIVYYQFDNDTYRNGHYAQGYFCYKRDGFGPIAANTRELEKCLTEILSGDKTMPQCYRERLDDFFVYNDRKNCRRNYEAIIKLSQKKTRKTLRNKEKNLNEAGKQAANSGEL